MIVDLLRHASTGRAGHLDGRSDPPLLDGAAAALRDRHRGIAWTGIVSSPRRRAADTARALAQPRGLPVDLASAWAELDFGAWDGRHLDDVGADPDQAAALAAFHRDPVAAPPPEGEPWPAFAARIEGALRALVATGDPGPVLVVCHAGPVRLAVSLACGLPLASLWALRVDYGARVRLRVEAGPDGALWGEVLQVAPA